MADQSIYPHGFQHQDDFERRRGRSGRGLGITVNGPLEADFQLSYFALTTDCPKVRGAGVFGALTLS